MVEHLTFNQRVRSSSLRRSTKYATSFRCVFLIFGCAVCALGAKSRPVGTPCAERSRLLKKAEEKTNAIRYLEQQKLPFLTHTYEGVISGADVAAALGEDPTHVYKTLVTVGKSGGHYVFLIPVLAELDLKKAADTVGEKYVEMLKAKDLLPLTGYIHGGCSPIGMKKSFPTFIDKGVTEQDTILFSGGRIGLQIETSPAVLSRVITYRTADLCR